MRRFYFIDRRRDSKIVIEGVQFSDGAVIVHWLTKLSSVGIYDSIDELLSAHDDVAMSHFRWFDLKASSSYHVFDKAKS